jgi:hypothetical protein
MVGTGTVTPTKADAERRPGLPGLHRSSAVLLAVAVVTGAATKAADESRVSWLGDLGTYPAVWVAALALIASFSSGVGEAALRSGLFFSAMCGAYYAWALAVLGFGGSGRFLVLWLVVAVLAVPPLAAALSWAFSRGGPLAWTVVATVAAVPLTSGSLWQLWWAYVQRGAPDGFPLRPVQALVDAAVVVLVVGVLPRRRSTRAGALLLLLPIAWTMGQLADPLRRLLPS